MNFCLPDNGIRKTTRIITKKTLHLRLILTAKRRYDRSLELYYMKTSFFSVLHIYAQLFRGNALAPLKFGELEIFQCKLTLQYRRL